MPPRCVQFEGHISIWRLCESVKIRPAVISTTAGLFFAVWSELKSKAFDNCQVGMVCTVMRPWSLTIMNQKIYFLIENIYLIEKIDFLIAHAL